jgi:hypothetical protein
MRSTDTSLRACPYIVRVVQVGLLLFFHFTQSKAALRNTCNLYPVAYNSRMGSQQSIQGRVLSLAFITLTTANIALADPVITEQPTGKMIYLGGDTTLHVEAEGIGSLSYQWLKSETELAGKTSATLAINNATSADSGFYTVVVTDDEGSVTSDEAYIGVIRPSTRYHGLFYNTNALAHETSGYIYVQRTDISFNAKVIVAGLQSVTKGNLAADGTATQTVVRTNFNHENLTLTLSAPAAGQITGSISGSTWTSPLIAYAEAFSSTNLTTNFAGYYTMAFAGLDNGEDGPVGYSYSPVKINTVGKVAVAGGNVADAQRFQPIAVSLSAAGQWPLYAPLYPVVVTNPVTHKMWKEYKGSVFGWVSVGSGAPSGTLNWIKTPGNYPLYPNGFTNKNANVLGSVYTYNPATPVLDMTNGFLTFGGGNLPSSFSAKVALTNNSKLKMLPPLTNRTSASLNAKGGTFVGGFRHPDNTNVVTRFAGILLQQQNYGVGFFAATNHLGAVELTPQ